jgi:hypothetical protein
MGFPSSDAPAFGGRTLNALSRKVETPFPTLDPETRRRVEQFIGCTVEQSYSEFTVELKNGIHRMLDAINDIDHSKPARHRGHAKRAMQRTRRIS